MKDELGGKFMTGFVALTAKLYAYRKIDRKLQNKLCKGTKKCVVAVSLTFDYYKSCLFDGKTMYKVHTVNKQEMALHRDDDKRRRQQADGIATLAREYLAQ